VRTGGMILDTEVERTAQVKRLTLLPYLLRDLLFLAHGYAGNFGWSWKRSRGSLGIIGRE
jgi:hypothetical protein